MTTYKEIFGKPIKVLAGDPAPTPVSFTVTASGGAFYIDGVLQKTLELYEGNTYIFTYPSGHPFRFATAADAAGSSEYTTGVTVDSSTQITIVVASGAPTLFYYCTNHSNMGGTILTPAGPTEYEGQIWYNEATGKFRSIVAGSAWASSANMLSARGYGAATGVQTASLYTGGLNDPGGTIFTNNEEYNGSGWTTGGALPAGRYGLGSIGTQTAAVSFGGDSPSAHVATTATYNGSTWTASPYSMNTARGQLGSAGASQTSALAYGGRGPGTSNVTNFEEWNGSGWTNLTAIPTAVGYAMGSGPETAAFFASGGTANGGAPYPTATFEYNGSTLSSGPVINTARSAGGASGDSSAGLIFGGDLSGSSQTKTERYDGTSWTEIADMAVARRGVGNGAGGSNASAIASGGYGPPSIATTEEFTTSSNIITAAAWASGGTLNTARQRTGGFGAAQTSAVTAAGATAPPASALNKTEEYNGTSWTEVNNVNTARYNMTAFGTEPAGVLAGVGTPSITYGGTTEEYDGTNWTTVNPYAGPGSNYRSSNGTQTAGLLAGGVAQPGTGEMTNIVEEYDGTNWSNQNNLPQYQAYSNQAGTQTAAINGGGYAGPAAPGPMAANAISLEYDGTNWTAGPNANLYSDITGAFNGGSGTQTAAMFVGGNGVGTTTYDGTTFATAPTVAAGRGETSAAGQAPAAATVIFAGSPVPSVGGTTLEFTAETVSVNKKNISTS